MSPESDHPTIVFDGVCLLRSRWVARHRYRLFGRRTQCRLPQPEQAWRFID